MISPFICFIVNTIFVLLLTCEEACLLLLVLVYKKYQNATIELAYSNITLM